MVGILTDDKKMFNYSSVERYTLASFWWGGGGGGGGGGRWRWVGGGG